MIDPASGRTLTGQFWGRGVWWWSLGSQAGPGDITLYYKHHHPHSGTLRPWQDLTLICYVPFVPGWRAQAQREGRMRKASLVWLNGVGADPFPQSSMLPLGLSYKTDSQTLSLGSPASLSLKLAAPRQRPRESFFNASRGPSPLPRLESQDALPLATRMET